MPVVNAVMFFSFSPNDAGARSYTQEMYIADYCPKCKQPKTQGPDYLKMAELAEKGLLRFYCASCDYSWHPDNQEEIAKKLRGQS